MKAVTAAAYQNSSADVAEITPEMEMVDVNLHMDMPTLLNLVAHHASARLGVKLRDLV